MSPPGPPRRSPADAREAEERLRSGKAVAAALLLAGVVVAAAAVFLWVITARSCAGPGSPQATGVSVMEARAPSI